MTYPTPLYVVAEKLCDGIGVVFKRVPHAQGAQCAICSAIYKELVQAVGRGQWQKDEEIRAAVEAERNHCAEAAKEYVYQNFDSTRKQWQGIAAAIRARGESDV
jgi:hypothetical protein